MNKLIIIAFSFCPIIIHGQEKLLKKGNEYFEIQQYKLALDNYVKVADQDHIKSTIRHQTNLKIAECFLNMHNPVKSEVYYSKVYNGGIEFSYEQKIGYVNALMEVGQYNKASEVLLTIEGEFYKKKILANKIEFALSDNSINKSIRISSLETELGYSSYGISLIHNKLVFINPISHVKSKEKIRSYRFFYEDGEVIYELERLKLPHNFNSLSLDYRNNIIYYSGNIVELDEYVDYEREDKEIGAGGVNNLSIWYMPLSGDKEKPTRLTYTSIDYSFTHPFVTPNGKTLYFTSNVLGSYGGYDLYKMEKSGEEWSLPENLGRKINTFLNEGYPFFSEGVLYFSSEGHPGYGGLDIFKTDTSTIKVENLKKPVNSSFDDFYYMHINPKKGYFSSNRNNENGIDGFYKFESK